MFMNYRAISLFVSCQTNAAPEESGLFSVDFPDLQGCYTSDDDLADAVFM